MSTEQVVSAARTTAEYSLRSAWGMGTLQQPCGIISSGWKEDCSCLAMVWLLSVGFRPEEVLCPMICLLSSFPLQAPWAAQVAEALPSGHKPLVTHCKAGGKCLLLRCMVRSGSSLPVYSSRLPLETSQVPYPSSFPAKCTLVLNHFHSSSMVTSVIGHQLLFH